MAGDSRTRRGTPEPDTPSGSSTLSVRLLDVPGRWLVLRTAELMGALERAVIDVEASQLDTVEGLAQTESRAQLAVGKDHDTPLVLMDFGRKPQPGHDPHTALATPVLAITVGAWHTPWQ
jgi:hypothetical protein